MADVQKENGAGQTTALTAPQIAALRYLATVDWAAPNQIGQAMGGTQWGKPQGLGRIGGAMAHRLIRKNLAVDMSRIRGGFPAYAITSEGRRMLAFFEGSVNAKA